MKKQETTLTYESAYNELQQIVRALQDDQVNIDELPERIARAGELIRYCRERLRQTESALQQLQKDEDTF
jgi:exodeoxyribonuclease VII small subunit